MVRQSLAKFARWSGVLLVSALTIVGTASGAHAQSATIRARATVVQPPVRAAAIDSAVARAALPGRSPDTTRTQLPGGVQVRRIEREAAVREVRVEFVAN